MHLSELKAQHVSKLIEMGETLEIENVSRLRKQELMFAIMKKRAKAGEQVFGDGVLEVLPDGFGFLRSIDSSYMASTDDIYLSPSQIRRFNLHTGDMIEGEVRVPKDGERYFALVKVDRVNGVTPEESKHKIMFENLTPLFPKEQFKLERDIKAEENITSRIIDLVAPIGKGQRALLVAQPKTGKTVMMQHIAHALVANHPEIHLIVLLVDERPEEVTEMLRTVRGEVISSTFDEPAARHVQVAEMVIERAKRLVELRKDVVILLDSITRLARAYNNFNVLIGYGVVQAVFTTDHDMSGEVVGLRLWAWWLLLGLLPVLWLWRRPAPPSLWQLLRGQAPGQGLRVVALAIALAATFSAARWGLKTVSPMVRGSDTDLVINLAGVAAHSYVPSNWISGSAMVAANAWAGSVALPSPAQRHRFEASMPLDDVTVVMVIGETARHDRWGMLGHTRDTTPQMQALPGVAAFRATSCDTSTKLSIACMFVRPEGITPGDGLKPDTLREET
ncbi:hypothetical protein B566_EDAN019529, partial [Ephemera danica]